ncbi:MAG: hypothetical protein M1814_001272 [Vezdaea aestivalis]|nr:MAG: hypothetical protein M1814_001272 [Vezdaea aestivalis]
MTSTSSPDPLEVRIESLTPVSPQPRHYPESSSIPVLQKQMDPVFIDASTRVDSAAPASHEQPAAHTNDTPAEVNIESLTPKDDGSEASSLYRTDLAETSNDNVLSNDLGDVQPMSDEYAISLENGDDNSDNEVAGVGTLHLDVPADPSSAQAAPTSPQASISNAPAPALPEKSDAGLIADPSSLEAAPITHTNDVESFTPATSQVDFKALLENLAQAAPSAALNNKATINATSAASEQANPTGAAEPNVALLQTGLPLSAALPPRPPPSETVNSNAGVSPQDDANALQLSNQQALMQAINGVSQAAPTYNQAPNFPPPVVAAGAPGTLPVAQGLPPPPIAVFQQGPVQSPQQSPTSRRREKPGRSASEADDEEGPWSPATQKLYDHFLKEERGYVADAQWEKFPQDSRLFVGNLATEKVTKRDIFHVFHKYGRIAQISIKNAYGFVQFFESEDCLRALRQEQDVTIRQKRCHLEISRPQPRRGERRRSRSPERNRENRGRNNGGRDRGGNRDRGRDDYRPGRSPSPRGNGNRGDSYRGAGERNRDRYDAGRKRSRSLSPYGRNTRYRDRSPSAGANGVDDDASLPLSRRDPSQVPEVQLIIIEDLDRNFIVYVEKGFKDKGIRTDVLFLSPRLPLDQVLRRQILEGVQAVVRLDRSMLTSGKIPLQLFDRRAGAGNVRFEEYANLDPHIAAELVLRARQTHAAPPPAQYGAPPQGYGMPQYSYNAANQPQAPAHVAAPNLQNLMASMDGQGLQKLLGTLNQQPPAPAQQLQGQANGGLAPELASLLGSLGQQPQQGYHPQAQQAGPPHHYGQPPLAHQAMAPPPDASRNVSNIMEQLAKWRQA